jgi:cyclopropane fatty-acyl-phospholipid synthase-like methyltransferase
MVNMARKIGVDAYGLDILPRPAWAHLIQHDLRVPYDFRRQFGMVISVETAEHIDPDYADVYCDTVARHVTRKGVLIFSAAMPGQPGDGHKTLRQASFWRTKFDARGLRYWAEWTYKLALALTVTNSSQHHLESNLQIFSRP